VTGPFCQFVDDCKARRGVHCRHCNGTELMRAINADPAFRALSAIRGTAQLRKFKATPAAAMASAKGSINGTKKLMRCIGVPPGGENIYRLARKNHFSREEAVAIAQREVARQRVSGTPRAI